jgi:5-methylcytosine-specific restriction endonuclease McrBC regulatory subunit McrC
MVSILSENAQHALHRAGFVIDEKTTMGLLDFVERETRAISIDRSAAPAILAEISDFLARAIEEGLLVIEISGGLGVPCRMLFSTSSTVGFATCVNVDGHRTLVRVRPKVGTHRMLELAALAKMLPKWHPGGASVSPTIDRALIEWTIGAFENSLRHMVSRAGLRNTHQLTRSNLKNRVRGRVISGLWLKNLARGCPNVVPCEFPSLEFDNAANRMLRWALHIGIALTRPTPETRDIADRLRRIDKHFSLVMLVQPRKLLINAIQLPPNLRHYAETLQLARLVIDSAHLGTDPGSIDSVSIAIDMDQVYERAFFNGLREIEPRVDRHSAWSFELITSEVSAGAISSRRSAQMVPDIVVDMQENFLPVVIDTKWKSVFSPTPSSRPDGGELVKTSETSTIRLRREDLYQITSYGVELLHRSGSRDAAIRECLAALVYPSLQPTLDLGREIRLGDRCIRLKLMGWNIAEPAIAGISAVWERIKEAARTVKQPVAGIDSSTTETVQPSP